MGFNPSFSDVGDNFPLENVTWNETQTFIQLLNRASGSYRLPTEAEWEYAARSGGKQERFSGGDAVDAVAWYRENSDERSHPVGQKQANGLGLYDMSGNVSEWCQDYMAQNYYSISPKDNPMGPPTAGSKSARRVTRGGNFSSSAQEVAASYRKSRNESNFRSSDQGFRVVLPVGQLLQNSSNPQ
jgi:formylglycine-generating enzyme required for sulfatase activity